MSPREWIWIGIALDAQQPDAPFDASRWRGLCFSAKGSGAARVQLPDSNTHTAGGVCQNCYDDFGASFQLGPTWQQYCFQFAALSQESSGSGAVPGFNARQVFGLQWVVAAPGVDALWVAGVQLNCE